MDIMTPDFDCETLALRAILHVLHSIKHEQIEVEDIAQPDLRARWRLKHHKHIVICPSGTRWQ